MNLHIVTPCTRDRGFLERCYASIRALEIPYSWFIVTHQPSYVQQHGLLDVQGFEHTQALLYEGENRWNSLLNWYLDSVAIGDQWVVVLDDDNLMHPAFSRMLPFLEIEGVAGLVFSQQIDAAGSVRRALPGCIYPTKVDQAQFIVRRSAIGGLRYWNIYRGDGYFLLEFRIRMDIERRQVLLIDQVACNYNAQMW